MMGWMEVLLLFLFAFCLVTFLHVHSECFPYYSPSFQSNCMPVGKVVSLGVGVFLGYVFSGWYIQMCKKLALEESRYIEMLEKQALEESREVSEQKDIVQKNGQAAG